VASPRVLSYGRQSLDNSDRQALLDVLDGEWLTQGPAVERFESALVAFFGAAHAVVCANGTAALHLIALALDWQPGDVVLVPAVTFLASANCAAYVGAEPRFVDIDPDTLTLNPDEVERQIIQLKSEGRRVKSVVGVDMAGHPCDWVALRALADRYDLTLVDDACHAMGAEYHGFKVGACAHADLTALSFHPVKHITTGEGGAVLTNNPQMAAHLRRLRSHGMERSPELVPDWEGPWHSEMVELGFNYRLTDLQCALGTSQMRRLPAFLEARREIASWYDTLLAGSAEFRHPASAPWVRHAYHLYLLRVPFGQAGRPDRKTFFGRCLAEGIQLQVHYRPVPLNSYYRQGRPVDQVAKALPHAMAYYREAVSVPMYPELTRDDVVRVVGVLSKSLSV